MTGRGWVRFIMVCLIACGRVETPTDSGIIDAGAGVDSGIQSDSDDGGPDRETHDSGDPDPSTPDAGIPACDIPDGGRYARLRTAWRERMPAVRAQVTNAATTGATNGLYNAQLSTAQLLQHADYAGDVELIESLVAAYRPAFQQATVHSYTVFYYASQPDGGPERREAVWPLSTPMKLWPQPPSAPLAYGVESVLDTSQFLYAISRLVRIIADLPRPSASLVEFLHEALPVALEDHYLRWLRRPLNQPGYPGYFQTRGWGCNQGTFDHVEHLSNLLARSYGTTQLPNRLAGAPGYCNAVTDSDLWILAGVTELVAAHRINPTMVPMRSELVTFLQRYIDLGVSVIRSRTTVTDGGAVFDPNGFDGHPDLDYAGYTANSPECDNCLSPGACRCAAFPGWQRLPDGGRSEPAQIRNPQMGLGWDLSHARRLVSVFDSLVRHRAGGFQANELKPFATQLKQRVWNGDRIRPQFTTFFDGSNGWYRVNYGARAGFGYPPFSMTPFAGRCGYGFWKEFEPGLADVFETLDNSLANPSNAYIVEAWPELLPYSVQQPACRR